MRMFVCSSAVTLVTLIFCHTLGVRCYKENESNNNWLDRLGLKAMLLLTSVDYLYYPLVSFVVYACLMPWAVGYVLNDRLGVLFAWGTILIDDLTFVHPDMIHLYGALAMGLNLYYIAILALISERAYASMEKPEKESHHKICVKTKLTATDLLSSTYHLLHDHKGIVSVSMIQAHNIWALYGSYGFISIISPAGVLRIFLTLYLYSKALSLEQGENIPQEWKL
jgi:hypothetical protein